MIVRILNIIRAGTALPFWGRAVLAVLVVFMISVLVVKILSGTVDIVAGIYPCFDGLLGLFARR